MIKNQVAYTAELNGANVLITGGSGFLGAHLVRALHNAGAREIINIQRGTKPQQDLPRMRSIQCDMSLPESVDTVKKFLYIDYVFNLAGLSEQQMPHPNPRALWDANVATLVHLTSALDWSRIRGAVHIGTTAEYGNQEVPFRETQAPRPTNAYGWTKAAATQYAIMMTQGGYAKWCVARQFTGYGPGQTTGFIVDLTRALKRGETFIVNASYVTRDPIFVSDTVEGLMRLACAPHATGEIVNLCHGKEISIGEIAQIVHAITGSGAIELVQREPRKGDFLRSWGDIKKIAVLTGWKPCVPLEEGLRMTIPTIQQP